MWRFFYRGGAAAGRRSRRDFVNWRMRNLSILIRLMNMRWIIFIILFQVIRAEAQVRHAWVGDTAQFRIQIMYGDTYWFPKKGTLQNSKWFVYYNSDLTVKAAYYEYGKYNCDVDTTWFRDGKIRSTIVAIAGCQSCATMRDWYSTGQLRSSTDLRNDTCISYSYYPSGKIASNNISYHDSTDFPNDMGWHVQLKYYENGQKMFEPVNPRLKGSQPFVSYYECGQKKIETTMFDYINYIGSYSEWYENGRLECTGHYAEFGRKYLGISATDKDGTWSYYSESGKLIKEEFYEEGKLVKTLEY